MQRPPRITETVLLPRTTWMLFAAGAGARGRQGGARPSGEGAGLVGSTHHVPENDGVLQNLRNEIVPNG